jgi:hypothetical protein
MFSTTDQTMEVPHIEKNWVSLNKLERFYKFNLSKQALQINDIFAGMNMYLALQ